MVLELVESYGAGAISQALDAFKELGFHYATQAGMTISKNNIVSPPDKEEILDGYEARVARRSRPSTKRATSRPRSARSASPRSGTRPPTRSRRPWRTTSTS